MKNYEKATVYLLLPFALIAHGIKKFGKFATSNARPVMAVFTALIMLLSVMPITAFAADNAKTVYINGVNGNDENDGTSTEAPVLTIKKAVELAGKDGTIVVMQAVNINPTVIQKNELTLENLTIERWENYTTGDLFNVQGSGETDVMKITLKNITVDGKNISLSDNWNALIQLGNYSELIIEDGAKLINNNSMAVYAISTTSNVYMTGGEISGNSTQIGLPITPGVYIDEGTFEMSGGTIKNNTNTFFFGGGVYIDYGTFKMTGGTICDNVAHSGGGGVAVNEGEFIMSGGSIVNNTADCNNIEGHGNETTYGGGVYAYDLYNSNASEVKITISGGEISGNDADFGDAMSIMSTSTKTNVSMSGSPKIVEEIDIGPKSTAKPVNITADFTPTTPVTLNLWGAAANTAIATYTSGLTPNADAFLSYVNTLIPIGFEQNIILSDISVSMSSEEFIYNGSEQKPIITVKKGETPLTEGTDYTVTFPTDCKNVGEKTVTVNFKGNYSGSIQKTFKISKAMLTVVQSLTEIDWYPGMSIDYDASALKNLFTVTDANGKNFTFKINAVYNSNNQPIEEIVDAGVYTIELQPFYNNLVGNYIFGTKPLTLTVKPLNLTGQSVTRDTSLDPTYTGETALPLATSSGKLNFDIGKVYDILTKKERSRTLWADDGYWKFEVIDGKNSTDAGDAYISIVGLGGNVIGSCEFKYTIKQQKMAAPEGLVAVDETISKKEDGKINGLTTAMEYSTSKYGTYKPVTDINMLFEADTYYVRTAAPNANYKPSDPVEITIGEGRKLTVTVPTAGEQIGYTLSVNTNEINWHGRVAITFALADDYSKSETDFAVKVNGTAVTLDDYGKYIVTDAESDLTITVEGVVDETAPEAEISITTNKWTDFLKDITFGLFFKETETVTITATDAGSGMDKIYYYISETELTEDEVKALAADKWTEYDADNKPSIDPDKKCVVYAKATDKAQNVKYISSTGLVFDGTAPVISGIENGKDYYGDVTFTATDALAGVKEIKVDGNAVTLTEGNYTISADNAEHTVTVTDKAGNITEWKITVYKQYTVTFIVDGETLTTQTVNHKADAEMPEIPEKEGYDQTAPTWDKDGKEITEDTTITAVYTINKYTVTYKADGKVVATVTVEHGKDATAPAIPEKEGYNKTAPTWDKDGKNITADTEINAVYTQNPADASGESEYPKAGDSSKLWMWVALAFISGGCLLGTLVFKRKNKTEE